MKAVVLVGGEGTRLRPLTLTTPKPLLPIANRPFLEHQLAWLAAHGFKEVVLSLGYRPDAFTARFAEGRFGSISLCYAVEPEPLGTAGAIRFAAGRAGADGERLVVCNGDVLTDLDLSALIRFHETHGGAATISLTQVEDPSRFGVVPTDGDGRVTAFVEKPPPGDAPTDWINAGAYVLEPSVVEGIPAGRAVSIERETFPALLDGDAGLFALASRSYWLDIGTPAKYLEANLDRLRLDGRPALFGEGCDVAADARVVDSVLGPACSVGGAARISRSVIHAGARIGPGAQVSDSVVGAGASIGPGGIVSDLSLVAPGAVVEHPPAPVGGGT